MTWMNAREDEQYEEKKSVHAEKKLVHAEKKSVHEEKKSVHVEKKLVHAEKMLVHVRKNEYQDEMLMKIHEWMSVECEKQDENHVEKLRKYEM